MGRSPAGPPVVRGQAWETRSATGTGPAAQGAGDPTSPRRNAGPATPQRQRRAVPADRSPAPRAPRVARCAYVRARAGTPPHLETASLVLENQPPPALPSYPDHLLQMRYAIQC